MSFCSKCGAQIADGSKFCPSCGNATETPVAPQQSVSQQSAPTPQQSEPATPPPPSPAPAPAATAGGFEAKDIEQNKVMAILSYLGILVLIPILGAKDSPYARFHANQGLLFCIAAILYSIAYSILSSIILAISWRLYWLVSILGFAGLVFAVLCVLGIINAANGQAKELPVIGKYRILK